MGYSIQDFLIYASSVEKDAARVPCVGFPRHASDGDGDDFHRDLSLAEPVEAKLVVEKELSRFSPPRKAHAP